jgi:predicted metal-binding membrane protein
MNALLAYTRRTVAGRLQHAVWSHPEWWSVALSGLAWLAMIARGWQEATVGYAHSVSFAHEFTYWGLSVVAMMLPLSLDAIRVTANGSLWPRRHRAIAGFLLGYVAPWTALGVLAASLRQASWTHAYVAPALGFAVAALWQQTRLHKRALVACDRRLPLAPLGWPADRDCLRFGATIGIACVQTCWPLMLACALSGHSVIAMMGGMAVGAAERWWFRPRTRAMLWVTLALATYYGVLAGLG